MCRELNMERSSKGSAAVLRKFTASVLQVQDGGGGGGGIKSKHNNDCAVLREVTLCRVELIARWKESRSTSGGR
jgi:hypothetical protein